MVNFQRIRRSARSMWWRKWSLRLEVPQDITRSDAQAQSCLTLCAEIWSLTGLLNWSTLLLCPGYPELPLPSFSGVERMRTRQQYLAVPTCNLRWQHTTKQQTASAITRLQWRRASHLALTLRLASLQSPQYKKYLFFHRPQLFHWARPGTQPLCLRDGSGSYCSPPLQVPTLPSPSSPHHQPPHPVDLNAGCPRLASCKDTPSQATKEEQNSGFTPFVTLPCTLGSRHCVLGGAAPGNKCKWCKTHLAVVGNIC